MFLWFTKINHSIVCLILPLPCAILLAIQNRIWVFYRSMKSTCGIFLHLFFSFFAILFLYFFFMHYFITHISFTHISFTHIRLVCFSVFLFCVFPCTSLFSSMFAHSAIFSLWVLFVDFFSFFFCFTELYILTLLRFSYSTLLLF